VGDTESPKDVYIKGKVASITEQYGTQYGNASFTISDDGTAATTGFTVFRALYLGNKKYTSGDLLTGGDEVIVCGKVTNYRGNTPETVQGKAFLYSLNGKSEGGDTPQPGGEAKGTGTLEDPFNAAAANAYTNALAADAKSDKDIYVKGKIIDIEEKNQFNTQYGNCTFYISDDGTDKGDKFYVFRTLYLGNVKYTDESWLLPKVGDEVVICGKLTLYKDKNGNLVPETSANNSYIYSLNGKTE
jgi:exonuclease VII large subunit